MHFVFRYPSNMALFFKTGCRLAMIVSLLINYAMGKEI